MERTTVPGCGSMIWKQLASISTALFMRQMGMNLLLPLRVQNDSVEKAVTSHFIGVGTDTFRGCPDLAI